MSDFDLDIHVREQLARVLADIEKIGRYVATLDQQARRLKGFVDRVAARPCEASAFYSIPEDGVSRCLDPEYSEMRGPDGDVLLPADLRRCDPCEARQALDKEVHDDALD